MSHRPVCILVTGEPVSLTLSRVGGFAPLIRSAAAGAWHGEWQDVDARAADANLPQASELAGVVITGSPASVTERSPWMLKAEAWLRELTRAGTPILGICFGHQLLGQALGGEVTENPYGREMGTVEVTPLADDPILGSDPEAFVANMSHRDTVLRLPVGARRLALTAREPNAAVAFSERVWGVQFHPEFDAQVMREYINERREALREEGQDPEALLDHVRACGRAAQILTRFLSML